MAGSESERLSPIQNEFTTISALWADLDSLAFETQNAVNFAKAVLINVTMFLDFARGAGFFVQW
jgi:hypothetical protein